MAKDVNAIRRERQFLLLLLPALIPLLLLSYTPALYSV